VTSYAVGFHPAARHELLEAADFYDLESRGLGTEFLNEVERAMVNIIAHPEASPALLGSVRKRAIARFPYSVVYSVSEVGVCVSAIAHNSRRPFYWRGRL
jgi:hypothetical protein